MKERVTETRASGGDEIPPVILFYFVSFFAFRNPDTAIISAKMSASPT